MRRNLIMVYMPIKTNLVMLSELNHRMMRLTVSVFILNILKFTQSNYQQINFLK